VLGDSASAHFSVPFHWTSNYSLANWTSLAEDELDFPHCSWSTGHAPPDAPGTINGSRACPYSPLPVDSIYLRMRERNRCNHRDYQNIAVNGARSTNMVHSDHTPATLDSLARDPSDDYPLVAFYALIGNDVCNGHPGNSSMTRPSEFEARVSQALGELDQVLPMGSHVVFVGLEHGGTIWDTMAHLVHPALNPVTYSELWGFLNCLSTNPCGGWLNADPQMRQMTTRIAQSLNDVYKKLVANGGERKTNYTHFDLHYLDYPIDQAAVDKWVSEGHVAAELFEPVGGGHPSQSAQALTAAALWKALEAQRPDILGPVNPNNERIKQLFGDQGGH
jgi:acyloxyacyl hydrolase